MAKASDIMTEDVATVRGSATVAEAVHLMKLKGLHSLIVDRRSDDDAYGIVTDTDIASKVVAYGKDPKQVRVYEVMTKPCVVVNPDLAVEYVARLFAQTGIDRAPVIQGDLVGIISVTDILLKADFLENPRVRVLETALQKAIAEARAVLAAQGVAAEATQAAWEAVNEIEAELAFCKGETPAKTAFEQYGDPQLAAELATA
ncbi:CBS domain-containing protein [Pantanalinema sp. GBBB05]|uniref:CBS domain-containing protein n=1 Tax=Pantanalinema sp. GBBB05 TaxID=2604139 RepID=UPI001D3A01AC|nr:CBS domain-containing protein [Pantanalinema sp. GBBB05]